MSVETNFGSVKDFLWGPVLGEGSYATVRLVKHYQSGEINAVKIYSKQQLFTDRRTEWPLREKEILKELRDSPFIVQLYGTFQDPKCLYFVMEYLPNGTIGDVIEKKGALSLSLVSSVAVQLVLILELMNKKKVVHRDLKPQNIAIDSQFNIRLIDFGTAKKISEEVIKEEEKKEEEKKEEEKEKEEEKKEEKEKEEEKEENHKEEKEEKKEDEKEEEKKEEEKETEEKEEKEEEKEEEEREEEKKRKEYRNRSHSFVGTPAYMPPEALNETKYTLNSDIWAFGCSLFFFFFGRPLFVAENMFLVMTKVRSGEYEIPEDCPKELKDLMIKCLNPNPKERLSLPQIREHPFFEEADWSGKTGGEKLKGFCPLFDPSKIDKIQFGRYQDFDQMDLEDALELLDIDSDEEVSLL